MSRLLHLLLPLAAASKTPGLPPISNQRALAGAGTEIAVTLGASWLLREHVLDARYIPSESMVPTFVIGDLLLLDKVSLRMRPPERGEVVCFTPPASLIAQQPSLGRSDLCMIKRVVAVAGDVVRVRRGRLIVNGRRVSEPYVASRMDYRMGRRIIPAGHVFVLGDNRNESYDSHVWGALDQSHLIGRPFVRYWPPKRLAAAGRFQFGGRRRRLLDRGGWLDRKVSASCWKVAQAS